MDKRPYDLWAEVPSPIKTRLRNAFTAYAEECFQKDGILLKAYVPAQVGGNMPKEEYLKGMKPEDLLDACFLMDFGECSEATFATLAEKAYEKPEIRAWFPEVMAVDIRRLGERKIPETYDDLLREEYWGEICLIGNKKMPDPLAGLYMLRKYGPEGLEAFVRNVASFAPPSETLRHVGRLSNTYGSIFLHAAPVCPDLPGKTGGKGCHPQKRSPRRTHAPLPETRRSGQRKSPRLLRFCRLPRAHGRLQMPAIGDNRFRIEKSCWELATEEELEIVFHAFHKK